MLVTGPSSILATRRIYNRYLFGPSDSAPSDSRPATGPIISRGVLNILARRRRIGRQKEKSKFAFPQRNFSETDPGFSRSQSGAAQVTQETDFAVAPDGAVDASWSVTGQDEFPCDVKVNGSELTVTVGVSESSVRLTREKDDVLARNLR